MHPEHPHLVLFPLHDDPRYALAVGALVRETVNVPQILCPALVGRGSDLEAPVRMLDAGYGGAVVVLGEAGIGKSRLVRELTGHARARGLVVVSGRAVQSRQPTPYRPLAEAVMGACRRLRLPADPELIPYRPALGRLLPEWSRPERDAAPVSVVTLGEGVLRLVKALAGEGGAVLVIEDLHWADMETLGVLEYVIDHALEEQLAVVATVRPGSSAGCDLVRDLIARRAVIPVELLPLTLPEVAEMARSALGTSTLPAGVSELLARADGVPFLIEELLSAAAEAGVLVADGDGWRLRGGAEAVVPRTFGESVRGRVEALAPPDRELMHLAALVGRLDPALLGPALGRPPEEVAGVLARCVELQLVVRDGAMFRFRHALTRDAVLAGLHPQVRAVLARRARGVLAALHPDLPGRWCELAAELSLLGGDTDDAARLLLKAAQRAVAVGALMTAAAVLGQARDLAPDGSDLADDIDELRTEVSARAGDVDAAFGVGDRLVATTSDPARRARLHVRLAQAAIAATQWRAAKDQLAAARRLTADDTGLVRVDGLAAEMLLGAGQGAEAEAAARSALAGAERLGLAEEACQALEVLGRTARNRDLGRAEQVFARQLDVATRHGLTLWHARATHELGTLDLMRANSTDRLARARELAAESGDLATAATIDLQLGGSGWLALDGGACLEAALRCQHAARRFHLDLLLAEALLLEAAGHGFTGRRAAMELAIAQAERIGRPEPDLKAAAWARRGMSALMREDRDRAVAAHDTAVSILREAATVYVRPYWLYWALLHTVQDDGGAEARAEARRLTQADSPLTELILGYADAVGAGRRGCADEAEALFARARSAAPAPGWAAQRHLAERLAAECAVADGWGQPARWLTEAAEFFRRAGHAHVERACRSLLRRAGAPLPRREHGHRAVPPALAALGVTDREAEVFALVTEGLTSKEIAARLFLSVRTVDKHVERLLAKTGVSRRAELRTFRT
jgi:DNA-binding CsgD family transcriptional regulator